MTSDATPAKADASAVLRILEWSAKDDLGNTDVCPICEATAHEAEGHHVDGCSLAAALQSSPSAEADLRAAHADELARYADYCNEREDAGYARGEAVGRSDMQEVIVAALDRASAAKAERDALRAENERLREALQPILKFVGVNDTDTLSRLRRNSEVLATASGSWTGTTELTLGHLRAINAVARTAVTKDQGGGHGE